MSQLVKAITASDTGSRKFVQNEFSPLFNDVFNRKELIDTTFTSEGFVAKIYKIGVTMGAQVMVDDTEIIGDQSALEHAIERTKMNVVEACFGEFRQDFLRINNALYDRDFQKARSLLTEFEKRMFEV